MVIIAATFLAYLPAMRNSFVWDDTALVLRDPLIRHWRLVPEAFQEFLFLDATASDFYRPVQRLTFTADYALWGINRTDGKRTNAPDTGDSADTRAVLSAAQPGWHFTSVLIHALAAVALFFFLREWLGPSALNSQLSTAASALWAVHPLHTSAVTYVSGRADSLAALFIFSALALLAKSHADGGLKKGDRAGAWKVIVAALCCLLALLSKEAGVAGLTLWLVWLLGKARASRASWIAFACSAVFVVGVYLSLRLSADRTAPPPSTKTTTLVERAGLMTRALAEYTSLFVAPHDLHMERDITHKPTAQAIAGGVLLAGFVGWALWARRKTPDAALALACAGVAWLPVSNVFTLNSTMAEHWLYVPSAFLIAALAFTARCLRWRVLPVIGAVWFVFLAAQTWFQHEYWKDQATFFNSTIERAGRGKRMLANLAALELEAGHREKGESLLDEAISLDPSAAGFQLMKASISLGKGDAAGAEAAMAKVEKDEFFASEILLLRSSILMLKEGKPHVNLLAIAAAASPRNWTIVRAHPLALDYLGQPGAAYDALLLSFFTRNYRAEGWRTLAHVAEKLGNLDVVRQAYSEAANRDCRDTFSRARLRELQGVQ